MKITSLIRMFALLVLAALPTVAQQTNSAWLTNKDRAKLESLRASGFEALFNLDYEAARKNFRELAESLPNHPAGPQFLAASLWIEALYQSRRLQASPFYNRSFLSPKEEKADPRPGDQFCTWAPPPAQRAPARP